jgi:hypothetical protein
MVVLVEAASSEADADLTKNLGDVLLGACAASWALWRRIIGEGLRLLELIATLLAPVLICGHREGTLSVIGQNGFESIGPISLNNNLSPCVPKLMSDLT